MRRVDGEAMENDLLLTNARGLVAVEVKTQLISEDVTDFLADLAQFQCFFPEYRTYRIYGAVAALDIPYDVSRQAYKRGLFVLVLTGDGLVTILNDQAFTPRNFALTES